MSSEKVCRAFIRGNNSVLPRKTSCLWWCVCAVCFISHVCIRSSAGEAVPACSQSSFADSTLELLMSPFVVNIVVALPLVTFTVMVCVYSANPISAQVYAVHSSHLTGRTQTHLLLQ